jgi:hypothetical protein
VRADFRHCGRHGTRSKLEYKLQRDHRVVDVTAAKGADERNKRGLVNYTIR